MPNDPSNSPYCNYDFRPVRGTSDDVIGIFGYHTDILMAYRCPHLSARMVRIFTAPSNLC
jgi:hypothetical protein